MSDATAELGRLIESMGIRVRDMRRRMSRTGWYWLGKGLSWQYGAAHYTGVWRERDTEEREIESWLGHARYHVFTHGWPAIAYCIGITPSGIVLLLRDIEEMGYHAFNANEIAAAVSCDLTYGQVPTPQMLQALQAVVNAMTYGDVLTRLRRENWYGHNEFKFYDGRNAGTNCPGIDLGSAIRDFRGGHDFAPLDFEEVEKKPDHAKIFVDGLGEKWVIGDFFWRWTQPHGNVFIFGYPISGQFTAADGRDVQVFERAIFRHEPGSWKDRRDIEITHSGMIVAGSRYQLGTGAFASVTPFEPDPVHTYFPQTGHGLHWGFRSYWDAYGGVEYFGYPISEEFAEMGEDGVERSVQYFERARFEWHPGSDAKHFDVKLGRVGDEAWKVLYPNGTPA